MSDNLYDVVVIGGGPAGLTAAIYLARARYRVLVLEKEHFGGQITITAEVVNYPGIERTSGAALTAAMQRQAEQFGAEFLLAEAERLDVQGQIKTVYTNRGELRCFGILLATGAHPRMIGFEGEEEFRGHGVAYCATCDGEFFAGKDVFVVGGGFAAAEESVFLTKYARHVTIMMRGADFSCAPAAANAAREHEKITVLTHTQVEKVEGDTALRYLRYRNSQTGEVGEYRAADGDTFGVFVFAGYEPETDLLRGIAELNEQGYVVTDRSQQTSVPGVYAAGDVCVKSLRQVVTAVGDGALAATELERYAAQMQAETGLRPELPQVTVQQPEPQAQHIDTQSELFTPDLLAQLQPVFERMQTSLCLQLAIDDNAAGRELEDYMTELSRLTDKLTVTYAGAEVTDRPCVRVCRADGSYTGLAFHGIPGGHEFTSFVLGLYNAAGPGQSIEPSVAARIQSLHQPISLKVLVSLSCTKCPELVTAAQRIAAENAQVTAEVYDLNHFPDLQKQYQVMSVPCMVLNDSQITFGKKNIEQILDWMEQNL